MGAGKSTIGTALAERLGRAFVDVDRLIEQEQPIARIFAEEGETAFRIREAKHALDVLRARSPSVIALGGGAVGSLPVYAATWSDNDSLFFLLRVAFGLLVADPVLPAKAAGLGLLLVGLGVLALHPVPRAWPLHRRALWAFGLFLLLSSTVHAWYLIWLLPLLALELEASATPLVFRPLPAYAWLLFSGLAVLPYLTYADHQWQVWISLAQYGPVYGCWVLAVGCWVARTPSHLSGARE